MSPRAASATGLLPLPGSPASSWALCRERLRTLLSSTQTRTISAFWLFGLINNVLYVIILSAAQDLVGSSTPKGVVLLADVLPSFATKLIAPYFIHHAPYARRILVLILLSTCGMLLISLSSPSSIPIKLFGIVLASLSSGAGELSFLGLTHHFGAHALAGWGSGTGAAGLVGAGMYVALTEWLRLSVRSTLLISASLPLVMFVAFFAVLPRDPLDKVRGASGYTRIAEGEDESPTTELLDKTVLERNLARARALIVPYMLPLFLVYVAEYSINQGVAPVLLFPLETSPFSEFREFYPFYGFLYQLGVFISRSSTLWIRLHALYPPSVLQVANLVLLVLQAMLFFIPNVYIVFIVIFWEGLLGGAVYVNTFAKILEEVPQDEREFSLAATSVSDSAGICVAGLVGIVLEVRLCEWQVQQGRDWCRRISVGSGR
ncbi:hypothetical protein TD95_001417 [Thielaviopsis punctulata]|uniref:Protein BTN n=1 Tax=Thielaviopsis punctulata TaxID=72032 RepID=A0A0F4Z943_9PEZI|nr:hypothetical protein TD95_001417 [Thielaviopsis punctulata]